MPLRRELKPSRVEVDPMPYERAHGRLPRGDGHWAFCRVDPRRADYLAHVIFQSGPYGQAKRAAQALAAAAGVEVLYVCS